MNWLHKLRPLAGLLCLVGIAQAEPVQHQLVREQLPKVEPVQEGQGVVENEVSVDTYVGSLSVSAESHLEDRSNEFREYHLVGPQGPVSRFYRGQIDWRNPSRITPYFGAGFGVVQPGNNALITTSAYNFQEGDSLRNHVAYELETGASWSIAPAWQMMVTYRHTLTEDPEEVESRKVEVDKKHFGENLVQVGLTYQF